MHSKVNREGRVPFHAVMANGFQFMQLHEAVVVEGRPCVGVLQRVGRKGRVHCGPHATVFASRWEFASSNEFGNHLCCMWPPQWGLPQVRTVVKQKTEFHADSINLQRALTVLRCWPIKVGGFEWLTCSANCNCNRTGSKSKHTCTHTPRHTHIHIRCMKLRICVCVTRNTAINGPGEIPK